MRMIQLITDYLKPVEDIMRMKFINAITGDHHCSDNDRMLLELPVKHGGIGLEMIDERSGREYDASRRLTKTLMKSVISRQKMLADDANDKKL